MNPNILYLNCNLKKYKSLKYVNKYIRKLQCKDFSTISRNFLTHFVQMIKTKLKQKVKYTILSYYK